MNEYADELESRATDDTDVPCRNCGHSWKHHFTVSGTEMGCDYEVERNIQTPGYAEMDVMTHCGCTEYIPMDSEDVLEREGKI